MTAAAAPDIQRLRAETSERLDFARRVLGTDGALVAWQVADPDRWLTGTDPGVARAQVAAIEAALASGRAGFDYGQRFVFARGGRGAMLVRLAQAPALCVAVDGAFRAGTDGRGLLASTYVPFDPDGSADAEALALSRLRRELAIALHEADPADALPPTPARGDRVQAVVAAAPSPFNALAEACDRLIDHAVAHEAVAALVGWAVAQAPGVAPLGLGADPAFTAPIQAALRAPAVVAATLAEAVREARWHVGLADGAAEAFAALRLDWGVVAAAPPLGPRRLLPIARRLADGAAHDGAPQAWLAALTPGTALRGGVPKAGAHPVAALAALADTVDRAGALTPPQRARLQAAAPAQGAFDHPLASDLRAALAADPGLRAWLGPDPSALPAPVALDLASLDRAAPDPGARSEATR